MRTQPGLGCRGIQPSRRPFAEHCYLNNTSTDQFARARSAFPFCYDRSAVAAGKAATGESWISDAACLRRMLRKIFT